MLFHFTGRVLVNTQSQEHIISIKNMDFGKQEREVDYIEGLDTGYSIKYTKANLQKIADIGLQSEGKISV